MSGSECMWRASRVSGLADWVRILLVPVLPFELGECHHGVWRRVCVLKKRADRHFRGGWRKSCAGACESSTNEAVKLYLPERR